MTSPDVQHRQPQPVLGVRQTVPLWEVYEWIDLSREPDPSSWPAPADWRTQLVQPIK